MPKRKREIPGQLPMFMSAREITAQFQPADSDRRKIAPALAPSRLETDQEVMGRKLTEVEAGWGGPSFQKSVTEEGVRVPVHLSHQMAPAMRRGPAGQVTPGRPEIGEGHHRIALSMEVAPDRLMPVVHHMNMGQLGDYFSDADTSDPTVYDPQEEFD